MKKIKVFGALTHFKLKKDKDGNEVCLKAGVDYARIIQPLTYLAKDPDFQVDMDYDMGRLGSLQELVSKYDILFSSYIDDPIRYVQLRVTANNNHVKWVLDLDDNLWDVDPSHPKYSEFDPKSEMFQDKEAIIKDMDHVVVTNRFLKYKVIEHANKRHSQIEVIPNFVDLTQYDYKKIKPVTKDTLTIGYCGGSSHLPDVTKPEFTDAIGTIMEMYPQVRFKTTFYMPQLKALFGYKYQYTLGAFDTYKFINEIWPAMMGESDIVVAPLSWSRYSRAKSYIKALEYGASRKCAGVYEDIDPYNEFAGGYPEEKGIFLARTKDDWVKYLSLLIENPDLRKNMAETQYQYVKDNHTIQKNYKFYANYFKNLTDL